MVHGRVLIQTLLAHCLLICMTLVPFLTVKNHRSDPAEDQIFKWYEIFRFRDLLTVIQRTMQKMTRRRDFLIAQLNNYALNVACFSKWHRFVKGVITWMVWWSINCFDWVTIPTISFFCLILENWNIPSSFYFYKFRWASTQPCCLPVWSDQSMGPLLGILLNPLPCAQVFAF